MKEIKKKQTNSFFKKIFIKICRLFGYEIIDQGLFYVPTQEKNLNENLSIAGKKSIVIPMGETSITRKVTDLTIILRSCTRSIMATQNKKRLFDKNKSEYTIRSFNSLVKAIEHSQKKFPQINFNLIITDSNSDKKTLNHIETSLNKANFKSSLFQLDISKFVNGIDKINAQKKLVVEDMISSMSNLNQSLLLAKDECKDLIYFVEDDYIHEINFLDEIIYTYERISSILERELILCPADYPYLYSKMDNTKIFLGHLKHWRTVKETLCTFLTSKKMVETYWDDYISMCKFEHYPFELPLHKIYEKEYCLSPIPAIALHCTNINSIFGISPNINWKKLWDNNATVY